MAYCLVSERLGNRGDFMLVFIVGCELEYKHEYVLFQLP